VSGLNNTGFRQAAFRKSTAAVPLGAPGSDGVREARVGLGRVLQGDDLERLLEHAGVARERLVDQGLQFARRIDRLGRIYFISNPNAYVIDGWVPLDTLAPAGTVLDPMHGSIGDARSRRADRRTLEVHLQIPPGGSLLVAPSSVSGGNRYESYESAGTSLEISDPWMVRFLKGGPTLPSARSLDRLISWTDLDGEEGRKFSGTAIYSTTFARPTATAAAWRLELGSVRDSARVRLNGRDLGTLIGPTFSMTIEAPGFAPTNVLEVRVTNLSANRIADLDRRGVAWKKFYNVNYPARFAENRGPDGLFTAAAWQPLESGLIGPVRLMPLRAVQ
jgi:hypothetical protein